MPILVFILILLVLVLIHEFGHFIVAKKLNVKVEEFAFGFPPRLFSRKKGETEYSFNLLPIGGYVKLYGEDQAGGGRITSKDESSDLKTEDESRAFYAQKPSRRFAIGVAGVMMNFLLAIVLSYIFLFNVNFQSVFPCVGNPKLIGGTEHRMCDIVIAKVQKDSPADIAGIKPNSKVLAINGKELATSPQTFSQIVAKNKGKNIDITLLTKDGKTYDVNVIPRVNPPKGQGALGVVFSGNSIIIVTYDTMVQKIFSGISHPVNIVISEAKATGQLFGDVFRTRNAAPVTDNLSGPIGIGAMTNQVLQTSDVREFLLSTLEISILLSTFLGFFNVLPIPALDGGRLLFIAIEWVTGRKVNAKLEARIHQIGMAFLLTILVWATFHDIVRIFSGGF